MNSPAQEIIVEQVLNASMSEVWNAITKLDEMKQWFFNNIPDFKAEVGFKTQFPVVSVEDTFTHNWEILELETGRKIKYHWSYKEFEGVGFVTFELFDKGAQTLLRLTNAGLESFPQNVPEFERDSCQAGWDYFIKGTLKNYLEDNK